jgi:hypothetical protein
MMKRNTLLTLGALFALWTPEAPASVIYVTDSGANTVSTIVRDDLTSVWSAGSPLISGLNAPMGIALDVAGNIYVANSGSGDIDKYDSAGQYETTIGNLDGVSWIAVDLLGNVFAVAAADNIIARFAAGGGMTSTTTGIDAPGAVTVDAAGSVYVVNNNGASVEIHRLNNDLTGLTPYVTAGLNSPGGLAFRGSELFVSNWFAPAVGDPRVDQFDSSGAPLAGYTDPDLGFAQGLAFSLLGDLFVANGDKVSRFNASGVLAESFAGFTSPMGLASGSVPEPETYAMIGGGLLLLGLVKRNR